MSNEPKYENFLFSVPNFSSAWIRIYINFENPDPAKNRYVMFIVLSYLLELFIVGLSALIK